MFQKVLEELGGVSGNLEREQLRSMAPAYLFAAGEQDHASLLSATLEQLLEELEKQQLFSAQSDGCLILSLEYGTQEWGTRGQLGLVDEGGQFKATLSQWVEYLMVRYQVSQGIVLIRLDCTGEQRAETIWWRRFFRQLHRHRKQFLFLFQVEQEQLSSTEKWLCRECFCRQIEPKSPDVKALTQYFEDGLEKYQLKLTGKSRKRIQGLLHKYQDKVTRHVLERWQQEAVWEYFLAGEGTADQCQILPDDYLTEQTLQKYLPANRENQGIGFEVTNDAS